MNPLHKRLLAFLHAEVAFKSYRGFSSQHNRIIYKRGFRNGNSIGNNNVSLPELYYILHITLLHTLPVFFYFCTWLVVWIDYYAKCNRGKIYIQNKQSRFVTVTILTDVYADSNLSERLDKNRVYY